MNRHETHDSMPMHHIVATHADGSRRIVESYGCERTALQQAEALGRYLEGVTVAVEVDKGRGRQS